MKKRILYTVLLAAGLAFSSCSDQFLQDMNPYDSYSPEKTFGIESNLDLYIQNVYYNYFYKSGMTPPQSYGLSGNWNDYSTYTEEKWGIEKKFDASRSLKKATDCETYIIRKSKFPQNPKRSVRFSGKRTKRSVQKRKARNTQKAETKVL